MKLIAFSLLDMKTGHFHTPFFMNHTGAALRAVIDLGQDLNTTVGRHPADFVLCQIGYFDDQSGNLVSETPLQLGTILSLLPRQQLQPSLLDRAGDPELTDLHANGRA